MPTKKIFFGVGILFFVAVLSGCSSGDNSPADKAGSQVTGMVTQPLDVNKKAQDDIANSVNKENANLNNALNEGNMDQKPQAPVINQDLIKKYPFATIKTSMGDIKVKLSGDKSPLTVTNFLQLASDKFYDGTKFHRVIKGFMIQGGDPLSKDAAMQQRWGTGGPGYQFKDELSGTETYLQGTLAMANSGPNTNGSQFFIVTASPGTKLPPSYTVFGQVVQGMDNALKIENVQTGAADRPVEDVTIQGIAPSEK